MASFFRDARLPQQRVVEGVPFPAVLVPSARAGSCAGGVDKFLAAVRCERASRLEPLVRDAGALLLRGFPATTAADFDRAVDAFGYEELPIVGSVAPRTNVVGRVFTANDSPPDQKIPFHHEMAQTQVMSRLTLSECCCRINRRGCWSGGGKICLLRSRCAE
ncbi:Clavaminate synthase-like protein [Zea mays]|uniref:Clavaminate synthase-like protein n=1 Tax=Zea mays TaxID=4577 RepID=B6SGS1_MAIZE|nr:hypothetical protein [Zea mays]ONM29005.1 Clavaminate synthase-like protein [Zea mays]